MPYKNRTELPESVRDTRRPTPRVSTRKPSTAPGIEYGRTRAAPTASPGARSSASTTKTHRGSGSKDQRRTGSAASRELLRRICRAK